MADEQRYFFLNMQQAGVLGGSQKANHAGWLELDYWDFHMNQEVKMNVGSGRPTKTSVTGTFSFTIKHNGPSLFKLASMGTYISTAITFEAERAGMQDTAGGVSNVIYLQMVFNKVALSHRSLAGDSGQKVEHIELSFETVNMTYTPVKDGLRGTSVQKLFDVRSNLVA